MAGLLSDLRLAVRGLRATPWTAAIAVLTLALGGRALGGLLFGVAPFDPVTFSAGASTVAALAVIAAWLPARRAMDVSPAELMREE